MAIRLVCVCGRGMLLPEQYAGARAKCPACHAKLHIPTRQEDLSLTRWFCKCGLRLKARPKSAGREVRCPRCWANVQVPVMDDHATVVNEKFLLDGETGLVELAPDAATEPAIAPAAPHSGSRIFDENLELEPLHADEVEEAARPVEQVWVDESRPSAPSPGRPTPPPAPSKEEILQLDPIPGEEYTVTPLPHSSSAADASSPVIPLDLPVAAPAPPARPAIPAIEPREEEEEDWADEDTGEGIAADELTRYFNSGSGSEAARAGVTQVLHGYWLYIPYALLAACLYNISGMIAAGMDANPLRASAESLLVTAVILFLWAGFIACIKDGVFERSMGIERMFHGALRHFLRFSGAMLLVIPIGVGLAVVGTLVIAGLWNAVPAVVNVLLVILAAGLGIFSFALLLISPVIAVLEEMNPFLALGRGLLFGLKHIWDLITLTVISMFVGGGVVGMVFFFWWLAKLFLFATLPTWLYEALRLFFGSLGGAAFMGQVLASLMLLYLSNIRDEERLQRIRRRIRGPAAVPVRLYIAILLAAIALLCLSHSRWSRLPSFHDSTLQSDPLNR